MDYIKFIAEDRACLMYRPSLNQITGGVLASILLSQVLYWWIKNDRKPFYKFSNVCQHRLYVPGDSWQEETGFSRREFEGARKSLIKNSFLSIKTTRDRVTMYTVNEPILTQALDNCYCAKRTLPKYQNVQLIESEITTDTKSQNPLESPKIGESVNGVESPLLRLKENKNSLLNARAEKKLEKKVKAEKEATKEEKELYHHIWETLLKRNDGCFSDYGKEGKATHGIVKKVLDRCKNNPSSSLAFFDSLVAMFELIKKKHDKDDFYKDLPFTPSTINSAGIFDRILTIGKNLQEEEAKNREREERYQQRQKDRKR